MEKLIPLRVARYVEEKAEIVVERAITGWAIDLQEIDKNVISLLTFLFSTPFKTEEMNSTFEEAIDTIEHERAHAISAMATEKIPSCFWVGINPETFEIMYIETRLERKFADPVNGLKCYLAPETIGRSVSDSDIHYAAKIAREKDARDRMNLL